MATSRFKSCNLMQERVYCTVDAYGGGAAGVRRVGEEVRVEVPVGAVGRRGGGRGAVERGARDAQVSAAAARGVTPVQELGTGRVEHALERALRNGRRVLRNQGTC